MFEFDLFEIMFSIIFAFVIFVFITILIRNIGEWHHNNESPRLTVNATVVAKRTRVSGGTGGTNGTMASTSYYVTFEVESGDRMELHLPGREYGQLAVGDKGKLSFQGTRYLGFERKKSRPTRPTTSRS